MTVNLDKTKVVHFRPGPKTPCTSCNITYGNNRIQFVKQNRYLGLTLNEFLDFSVTSKYVAKAAHRALGLLIAKSKAYGGLPFHTFQKLYDSLVQPIIDYGAGIWGTQSFSWINSVQHRAERFYLGLGKYVPNNALQGEMGWRNPEARNWISVCHLWLRLLQMDSPRLNCAIFEWAKNESTQVKNTWCGKVKNFLKGIGMGHACRRSEYIDPKSIIQDITKIIDLMYAQKWTTAINSSSSKTGQG